MWPQYKDDIWYWKLSHCVLSNPVLESSFSDKPTGHPAKGFIEKEMTGNTLQEMCLMTSLHRNKASHAHDWLTY